MAQRSMLTLTGRQRSGSGEESVIESRAAADYYEKDGSFYILYEEPVEDTGETVKNIIKCRDGVLEITRRGAVRSRMIFEAGQTHRTDYATPWGTLSLETCTRKAETARLEDGIEIRLDYVLSSEGEFLSECALELCLALPEKIGAKSSPKS